MPIRPPLLRRLEIQGVLGGSYRAKVASEIDSISISVYDEKSDGKRRIVHCTEPKVTASQSTCIFLPILLFDLLQ